MSRSGARGSRRVNQIFIGAGLKRDDLKVPVDGSWSRECAPMAAINWKVQASLP